MTDKKKFGLVMPKKTGSFKMPINSVFNNDSDEDEKANKRPKIPQKKLEVKSKLKTEPLEDPSIYEYDSIYDDMKAKQAESIVPKEKKNSRYIETLLKAADKRKKEYERRIDKKIQVEREKEGDKFKDKEAFVTSTYKKKLQEKEEEEERERRENMLNEMMDVTKQKDLSGFYRHFLNQTVGEEKVPVFGNKQIKQEIESDDDHSSNKPSEDDKKDDDKNIDQDSDGIEIDTASENQSCDDESDTELKNKKLSRKMASRNDEGSKEILDKTSPKRIKRHSRKIAKSSQIEKSSENTDTDAEISDCSVDKTIEKNSHSNKRKLEDKSIEKNKRSSRHDSSSSDDDDDEVNNKSANSDTEDKDLEAAKTEKQPQQNIFAKRTIGDIFAEAQARFFQRMATRNSGI